MAYDAWLEGYKRALRSPANYFHQEDSVRNQRVGDWIVSAKIIGGCQGVICIYNSETLMEHHRENTIGLSCMEDAPDDIKAFYNRAFERDFQRVVELAEKWSEC